MLRVNQNQVTLSRNDNRDYYGMNQVIDFHRDGGIESHDYVEFHLNGSRVEYCWCKDRTSYNFKCHGSLHSQTSKVVVKYFERGGLFWSGSFLAEMKYDIVNPVSSFDVQYTKVEIGCTNAVSYSLRVMPDLCTLAIKDEDRLLGSFVIHSLSDRLEFPAPRAMGNYQAEIVCGGDGGSSVLGNCKFAVTDAQGRGRVQLIARNSNHSGTKLITIQPHDTLEVSALGDILQVDDEVVVVTATAELTPPNYVHLNCFRKETQTLQNGRTVQFTFPTAGIFHVCLCLKYLNSLLLSDYLCVIVSPLAAPAAVPSNLLVAASAPLLPALQPPEPLPPSNGCKCIACLDNDVCIKLEPCKHVMLCEHCCNEIRRSNNLCPACNVAITGTERVFVLGS